MAGAALFGTDGFAIKRLISIPSNAQFTENILPGRLLNRYVHTTKERDKKINNVETTCLLLIV